MNTIQMLLVALDLLPALAVAVYFFRQLVFDGFYHRDKIQDTEWFRLTDEHPELIKHASMRVHPDSPNGPLTGIDEKRPYSDFSYFEADMAKILGYPPG